MKFIYSSKQKSFYNLNSIENINCNKLENQIVISLEKTQFRLDTRTVVNQNIYGDEEMKCIVLIRYEVEENKIDEKLKNLQVALFNFLDSDCKVFDLDSEMDGPI